jgi:hypothetical protein
MQFLQGVMNIFGANDDKIYQLFNKIVDDFNYTFNLNGGFPSTNCALQVQITSKPKTEVCSQLKQMLEENLGNEFLVLPIIDEKKKMYYYFVQLTVSDIQPFVDFSNANKDLTLDYVEPDFFDKAFPHFLPDEDGNPTCREFIYHIGIAIQAFKAENNISKLIELYNNNCTVEILMDGRVSSKYMEALNRVFSRGDKIMLATKGVTPDDSKTQIFMEFSKVPQAVQPLMLTAGTPRRV